MDKSQSAEVLVYVLESALHSIEYCKVMAERHADDFLGEFNRGMIGGFEVVLEGIKCQMGTVWYDKAVAEYKEGQQ